MDALAPVRLRLARQLEEGTWDGPVARALALGWDALSSRALARPLGWREGLRVVAIGGATLGGSGKTPLAIACARALAHGGARVAFVGHAYRARPGGARVVAVGDDVRVVGDEALVAARALDGIAPVVVAPTRQVALAHASQLADVIVLDGVLQTAPRRASLALLALDASAPWGAGGVVPRGDLRASRAALLAACDGTVRIGDADASSDALAWTARPRSEGASHAGTFLPWETLRPLRLGLFTALARPARVLAALAREGVVPLRTCRAPDHGIPPPRLASLLAGGPQVDLWLASPKCALHLEAAAVPHGAIDHKVELSPSLLTALKCLPARAP